MPDQPAVTAAYQAGATTRQLAAEYGVHESTIRAWLAAAGVARRARGPRENVDVEQILALRRRHKLSWEQIAQAVGASKSAVRLAYRRATGDPGRVDRHKHLTARQADRLRELQQQVPETNRGRATLTSHEGRRLVEQVAAHRAAGVTAVEIAQVLAVTPTWVTGVIRER